MASNGRLPASHLAAIPGGRLRKDAAAAWNAMSAESRRRFGVQLRPLGGMSSYRTYAQQQYFWNLYRSGRGNLAARPGTSNHGWGLAVDIASQQQRRIVDRIGAKYGWAKRWSDAPSEWWHLRWRSGVWKAPASFRALRYRSQGSRVKWVQRRLRAKGFLSVKVTGFYGQATVSAIKRFQRKKGLSPDGVVGPTTWRKLAL
jgi:hypothetical protein